MCSRPRQLHFLTHSLSSVLVHATQSRSSACPAVSLALFFYLPLCLSSSLAVLGSFSGRACLLFVCLIFTTLRMSAVSQSSISCHHLLNDGGGNSSSVWAAPATLLPSLSLAMPSAHPRPRSTWKFGIKCQRQLQPSPSSSSFVVCMPICARFSLVFPFSNCLYSYCGYISLAEQFAVHLRRYVRGLRAYMLFKQTAKKWN